MSLNGCARRMTTSASPLRCCLGTTASKAFTRRNPLGTRHRFSGSLGARSAPRSGRRSLSASAPSSQQRPRGQRPSKRKQKQKQAPLDKEPGQIPKWSTTASVLIVPFMFAAWGVSDWIFGNRTKGHNEALRQDFLQDQRRRHTPEKGIGNDADDDWLSALDRRPTLLQCVIRKSTGVTHCLSGVQLGDVVEVLEEGVGPDQAYNLCRLPAKTPHGHSLSRDTYGWFPIRWLQTLEHYESMVREQEQRIHKLSREDPE